MTISDVVRGHNMLGDEMIWVGEELTVGNLLNRYSYLKENYGLNALKLGFSIGISESSISRIFNKRNKAQRSTLIALDVALSEWEYLFEGDDD
jgi:hypothetical protein|tara:strand:- start:260 stop:538 length:279 start_codon:yes stop_codon:yes gene_type:complete